MARLKLSEQQRQVLALADNPAGRCGWPLSTWEGRGGAKEACQPLIAAGYLVERRLAGYPGVAITPEGRAALGQGEQDA